MVELTNSAVKLPVVTDANIRGAISVGAGSGLTYSSSTGIISTSAIPNSQLANSSVTLGSTSVSLGATATSIAGLTALTAPYLIMKNYISLQNRDGIVIINAAKF